MEDRSLSRGAQSSQWSRPAPQEPFLIVHCNSGTGVKGGHIPGLAGLFSSLGNLAACENRGCVAVSRVGTAGSSPGGRRGGAEPAAAEGEREAGQGEEMGCGVCHKIYWIIL